MNLTRYERRTPSTYTDPTSSDGTKGVVGSTDFAGGPPLTLGGERGDQEVTKVIDGKKVTEKYFELSNYKYLASNGTSPAWSAAITSIATARKVLLT